MIPTVYFKELSSALFCFVSGPFKVKSCLKSTNVINSIKNMFYKMFSDFHSYIAIITFDINID